MSAALYQPIPGYAINVSLLVFGKGVVVVIPEQRLVAVAPREGLCADVHVSVLLAILDGRLVRLVLPVLVPSDPGVDGRNNERRNNNAGILSAVRPVATWVSVVLPNVLDGKLSPEVCREQVSVYSGRNIFVSANRVRLTRGLGGVTLDSQTLAVEGVVVDSFELVDGVAAALDLGRAVAASDEAGRSAHGARGARSDPRKHCE